MPRRARNPFQVICGTSAGALNAVTLAVNAQHFRKGVKYLLEIWNNAQVSDIYRSDVLGVLKNSGRWLAGLVLSLLGINRMNHVSLLDNSPLATFLEQTLPCEKIQENIDAGVLHALSITASGYGFGPFGHFLSGRAGDTALEARAPSGRGDQDRGSNTCWLLPPSLSYFRPCTSTANISAMARCARSHRSARRCIWGPTRCW